MPRSLSAHRASRIAASSLLLSIALDAAAAQTAPGPARDDIDLIRGCWIQKVEPDGRATLLLRLLPDRERKDWLTGQLQRADGDDPDRRLRLMFARDGLTATLATTPLSEPGTIHATPPVRQLPQTKARKPTADAMASLVHNPQARVDFSRLAVTAPLPKNAEPDARAFDYREPTGGKRLRVEVSAERLKLSVGTVGLRPKGVPANESVLFDGRRDGCD